MNEQRREFIKKTALGVLVGFGAAAGLIPAFALEKTVLPVWDEEPVAGKIRWGMLIDTRKCKADCQQCVAACHHEHNVPDFNNSREEIKWIEKSDYNHLFAGSHSRIVSKEVMDRSYLALCNHCADAPCVSVCPTEATFKRWDGIVAMDYHRCTGCRACMAACPYGSRSFNWQDPRTAINDPVTVYPTREQGVVEKCNFCSDRLVKELQPACLEACPEQVLTFGDLNDPRSDIRMLLASNETMQRRPESGTKPSVFYIF
ncbi:MAG: 4Fe-4S dicluster domain-containing protein [Chlorobium sp.]|nr:4Fe-4S dicluster domain-containing protein [Chlorobium sp.]